MTKLEDLSDSALTERRSALVASIDAARFALAHRAVGRERVIADGTVLHGRIERDQIDAILESRSNEILLSTAIHQPDPKVIEAMSESSVTVKTLDFDEPAEPPFSVEFEGADDRPTSKKPGKRRGG